MRKSGKVTNDKMKQYVVAGLVLIVIAIVGYFNPDITKYIYGFGEEETTSSSANSNSYDMSNIPEYTGEPYVIINGNKPQFTEADYTTEPFEEYAELDSLGRCGVTFANICREVMPKEGEVRGDISSVKPTGWKQKKINGEYLYNRCHLIGYQLANENANERNLITGTRYFNVTGMLPFVDEVADYIKNQGKNEDKHVLYRVTPAFDGDDLVAKGVQMEAYSVEDNGEGVCFNVYVYNVQPGVVIDYATGESRAE